MAGKPRLPGREYRSWINHAGYRVVWDPAEKRKKLAHRVAMERILGRALMPWETVHHRDGNRLNNDPANLEHRSSRHGPGQRVEDLPPSPGSGNPFWRFASRPRHLTRAGLGV